MGLLRLRAQRTAHDCFQFAELVRRVGLFGTRSRQVHVDHLGDASGVRGHDHDAVGEHDRLRHGVRDEHHGLAVRLPEVQQSDPLQVPVHLVEGGERLVHQHDRRVEHERPGDRGALLHTPGELPRVLLQRMAEAEGRQQLGRVAERTVAVGPAVDPHGELDVLAHRLPRQQRRRLRHESDLLVTRGRPDALAVDRDGAGVGVEEPGDHLEQRGLPATAGPDHRDELAHPDRETHVIEHGDLRAVDAEGLRDVPDLDAGAVCDRHHFSCQIRVSPS